MAEPHPGLAGWERPLAQLRAALPGCRAEMCPAAPVPPGLPRLRRIDGRRLDAIRTPDGRVLPGEFFPHMLKDVSGVRRFQVVQETLDRFTLKLVPGPEFGAAQEEYVRREVTKVLGADAGLELQRVDDIPLTDSGKFRVTVSRLP